jgi:hypothetical protein
MWILAMKMEGVCSIFLVMIDYGDCYDTAADHCNCSGVR